METFEELNSVSVAICGYNIFVERIFMLLRLFEAAWHSSRN